jgi:hypothetical protein
MIKMEQKRRIKGGKERDTKKVKGKAVIDIAIAAIVLASVFAATVPMVCAESRGDNFNHIVVQQTPQKVLIGQNLQFEGFDGTVAIYRMVSGDIENVYAADANNRIYNVNWPKSGNYYVNYDYATKDYEAPLSVEELDMPLELKVGTKKVSSIAVGTHLTIDTDGMNLFPEDQVDLVINGPDGQIKYDDVNHQQFTDITVADLTSWCWYGDNNFETAGWTIGDYTFQVRTDQENACGLEAVSRVKPLKILKGEIAIEAETTTTVELDTLKLIVTGVAGDPITVEASPLSRAVMFKEGIDDTPIGANYHVNWFNDTIDADGIRQYAVVFNDMGIYTIKVTFTGGDREVDSDTVEIMVLEKEVTFDLPPIVVIGDKIAISGTSNSGTYVSVYIDDTLYRKLVNIVIEDGKFSQEVRTTDIGMDIPGIVNLKAWIDCDKYAGEERPTRSPDDTTNVLMVAPWLTASLSTDSVDQEDDFIVSGTALGSTEVTLLCVPPRGGGGKSLLDNGERGLSPRKASVSTTTGAYMKKMTVPEDADSGVYYLIVLSSGMDRVWGMTGQEDLEYALHENYYMPSLTMGIICTKTQDQIVAILKDLTQSAGSDDLMRIPIRKDGSISWITVNKPYYEIVPQAAIATDKTFSATFDTTGAQPGIYTVKANDGYGYTTSTSVNIIAGAPP